MMTAREAMAQAIERAQLGDVEPGRLWLDIARELRLGTLPVAMSGQGKGYEDEPQPFVVTRTQNGPNPPGLNVAVAPDGQLVYTDRAETQVMQRVASESTPAYDEAGQSLGDTRSIPHRIAHPQEDAVGPSSTCLTPECGLPVIWIRGRGWVHDTPSHTASCDKAAEEAAGGDAQRSPA